MADSFRTYQDTLAQRRADANRAEAQQARDDANARRAEQDSRNGQRSS